MCRKAIIPLKDFCVYLFPTAYDVVMLERKNAEENAPAYTGGKSLVRERS